MEYTLNAINDKNQPWLQCIVNGSKKAEVRIATDKVKSFKIGDTLTLNGKNEFVKCKIVYLHFYKSFEEMLDKECLKNVAPFLTKKSDALKLYYSFPGAERVKTFGCCAIGVEAIKSKLAFTI